MRIEYLQGRFSSEVILVDFFLRFDGKRSPNG